MDRIRVIPHYADTRVPGVRDAWDALIHQRRDEALFYQSPSYFDHLASRDEPCALSLAVFESDSATVGLVPLWAARTTLAFRVKSLHVGALSYPCVRVLGATLLVPQEHAVFERLFEHLGRQFSACALIEIKGLPTASALWHFLRKPSAVSRHFFVYVPNGPRRCHWTDVPATFDLYLARFKRKKRYNLKRQLARLEQHAAGKLSLHRIERPCDVPLLAQARRHLSHKRDAETISDRDLADLAKRGLLLSYVLTAAGVPCALALGTRFGSTHLVHMFAHDQALDHLSPGTVLHTLMVRDIIDAKLVRRIDYGFGEPRYRLGNNLEERVTVMLVRRTILNRSGIMAHATFDHVVGAVKQVLRRRAERDVALQRDDESDSDSQPMMTRSSRTPAIVLTIAALAALAGTAADAADATKDPVRDRGRYVVTIAGCNDCHTPNYGLGGGKVDEKQWLIGDSLGWRGPWGTTYAINLRLYMQNISEKDWVAKARTLETRPPMPWFNVQRMSDGDLRAIHRYIRSLGPAGEPAPAFVPPNQEPRPPYVTFPAPPPK